MASVHYYCNNDSFNCMLHKILEIQQQYQYFPSISYCYVRFGLWDRRIGFGFGMILIGSNYLSVVGCGRFCGIGCIYFINYIVTTPPHPNTTTLNTRCPPNTNQQ